MATLYMEVTYSNYSIVSSHLTLKGLEECVFIILVRLYAWNTIIVIVEFI